MLRKCHYCDEDELCGVGPENTPVCERHFNDYLKNKRVIIDKALESLKEKRNG